MYSIWNLFIVLFSLHLVAALKFDLVAQPPQSKNERCIRNFVKRDTLVVVTTILDGTKGDGQIVNMHVRGHEKSLWRTDFTCRKRYEENTDTHASADQGLGRK